MAYLDTYDYGTTHLKVEVFPSTRRVRVQQDARETSEKTVTGIVSNLVDYKGFAITQVLDMDGPFEFNIRGYYFKVNKTSDIFSLPDISSGTQIWASIVIDDFNSAYPELWGQDDSTSGKYQGVNFTSSEQTTSPNGTVYCIQLFSKVGNTWVIVNTQKFGATSVNVVDGIDGGTF